MPCYHPMEAYQFHCGGEDLVHPSGKPRLIFNPQTIHFALERYGDSHEIVTLPCGSCIGCHLKRAGEWALRCVHESRYYERNSFITLTYDNDHLPEHRTLVKKHYQDFAKRMRIWLQREHSVTDTKYFMCGEYGNVRGRPHYHAVLFGWNWPDKIQVANNPTARDALYESAELTRLWGHGITKVGDLTPQSAAYVAQYTMKKVHGELAEREYHETNRIPPYNCMSKGIGRRYFEHFKGDMYPSDYLISEESKQRIPIPRFYDKLLEELSKAEFEAIKAQRKAERAKYEKRAWRDQSQERRNVMEQVRKLRIKRLQRVYENETKHVETVQNSTVKIGTPIANRQV